MQILKDYAFSLLGLPYTWGGDDTIDGFDCSGLVIELLQSCDLFPHGKDTTAQGLYNKFRYESEVNKRDFGSLVFFGKNINEISHVGFMIDNFRMIEAGGGNSQTKNRDMAKKQNAFVRIRPINIRSDLVSILHPYYHLKLR